VLFGVMLNGTSGLHAFPWGFFYESSPGGSRLAWRLVVSICCFYLLPAAQLGIAFHILASYPERLMASWHAPALFLSALSVFAPYRLFMFLMIGLRTTPLRLYSRSAFEEIAVQRHLRRSTFGQFLSFLFFSATVAASFLVVGMP